MKFLHLYILMSYNYVLKGNCLDKCYPCSALLKEYNFPKDKLFHHHLLLQKEYITFDRESIQHTFCPMKSQKNFKVTKQ